MKRLKEVEHQSMEIKKKVEEVSCKLKHVSELPDGEGKNQQIDELEMLKAQLTASLDSSQKRGAELKEEISELKQRIESLNSALDMEYFNVERESHYYQELKNSSKADSEEKIQISKCRLSEYNQKINELSELIKKFEEQVQN